MQMDLFKSSGILKYGSDWRLALEIDQQLADYYRSLIPKWFRSQRPRWSAHVTVVRPEKEVPVNKEFWNKYKGEIINFEYSPYIHEDDYYYWINVYSTKLEEIRRELGLHMKTSFNPPVGYTKSFHCTIANKKD